LTSRERFLLRGLPKFQGCELDDLDATFGDWCCRVPLATTKVEINIKLLATRSAQVRDQGTFLVCHDRTHRTKETNPALKDCLKPTLGRLARKLLDNHIPDALVNQDHEHFVKDEDQIRLDAIIEVMRQRSLHHGLGHAASKGRALATTLDH
jgi:hypothetical protein